MCVIAIASKTRPDEKMVKAMWDQNDHGGGIAWREQKRISGKEAIVVRWRKGLDLDEMQGMIRDLPMPFVAHFRIASCGGKRPEITHPFAVEDHHLALDQEGYTQGGVLFHNGHWTPWQDKVFQTASDFRIKIPKGRWTDSRAMAWMANFYGNGFLDMINEKTVIFGPDFCEITGSWNFINGVHCSNDYFQNRYTPGNVQNRSTMCKYGSCTRTDRLDTAGFCPNHTSLPTPAIGTTPPTGGGAAVIGFCGSPSNAAVAASEVEDEGPGGSDILTPFALRQTLAKMELEWKLFCDCKLKRSDLKFSKQELKRMRKAVAALTDMQLPESSTPKLASVN